MQTAAVPPTGSQSASALPRNIVSGVGIGVLYGNVLTGSQRVGFVGLPGHRIGLLLSSNPADNWQIDVLYVFAS